MLNGQPELAECWFKSEFPVKELELIILFTDGFVPYEEFNKLEALGEKIVEFYETSGLYGLLEETRDFESQNKEESYTDFREATAIAIEF